MTILTRLPSRIGSMKNIRRNAHFLNGLDIEKRGMGKISNGYFDDKTLLIYFSSSWCPSCKLFTPKLKRVYEDASNEKLPLEVLWVSRDRTQDQLIKYYESKLPAFTYFPFGSDNIPSFLTKYDIKTIPSIRLISSNGDVLSDSIRVPIEKVESVDDTKNLFNQWKQLNQ